MAGAGSRFVTAGYKKPKPFIDVFGKTMIERVMDNLSYKNARYILIVRDDFLEKEAKIIQQIKNDYNCKFLSVNRLTEGACCTILLAVEEINNDQPLLTANCDQYIDIDIKDYIADCKNRDLDGSILTFFAKDKKWSYAKINASKLVTEVKEKEVISEYATVGLYYFSKGRDFVNNAIKMIANNDRVNNEFYTCPVYNYAIRSGLKIGIYNIDSNAMHGLGTPEDLEIFIEKFSGSKFRKDAVC